ncbi:arsenical-resistance protein ACR3, partial [Atractiella rhizophila]
MVTLHNQTSGELTQAEAGGAGLETCETDSATQQPLDKLSFFDRWLAVWVALSIGVGIVLGNFTSTGDALRKGQFVGSPVPIAVGLLVMMYPILCKVRYENLYTITKLKSLWIQIAFSLFVNWLIAPLFMVALAWAFLPDQQELREGLILVGLARCIAMVLVWTKLTGGDGDYCALLVALNSVLQIILYAPLALAYIDGFSIRGQTSHISYSLVAKSVAAYLGIPFGAAVLTRFILRRGSLVDWYDNRFLPIMSPFSLLGLVYTIVVLFASQSSSVTTSVVSIVRVASPLLVYFASIFFATLAACLKIMKWNYDLAITQSFTASSNNFELAIAVAISTYGPSSKQAVATTVGVLVEVPVMVALVYGVRFIRGRLKRQEVFRSKERWT